MSEFLNLNEKLSVEAQESIYDLYTDNGAFSADDLEEIKKLHEELEDVKNTKELRKILRESNEYVAMEQALEGQTLNTIKALQSFVWVDDDWDFWAWTFIAYKWMFGDNLSPLEAFLEKNHYLVDTTTNFNSVFAEIPFDTNGITLQEQKEVLKSIRALNPDIKIGDVISLSKDWKILLITRWSKELVNFDIEAKLNEIRENAKLAKDAEEVKAYENEALNSLRKHLDSLKDEDLSYDEEVKLFDSYNETIELTKKRFYSEFENSEDKELFARSFLDSIGNNEDWVDFENARALLTDAEDFWDWFKKYTVNTRGDNELEKYVTAYHLFWDHAKVTEWLTLYIKDPETNEYRAYKTGNRLAVINGSIIYPNEESARADILRTWSANEFINWAEWAPEHLATWWEFISRLAENSPRLSKDMLMALIYKESKFNNESISSADAKGYMQIRDIVYTDMMKSASWKWRWAYVYSEAFKEVIWDDLSFVLNNVSSPSVKNAIRTIYETDYSKMWPIWAQEHFNSAMDVIKQAERWDGVTWDPKLNLLIWSVFTHVVHKWEEARVNVLENQEKQYLPWINYNALGDHFKARLDGLNSHILRSWKDAKITFGDIDNLINDLRANKLWANPTEEQKELAVQFRTLAAYNWETIKTVNSNFENKYHYAFMVLLMSQAKNKRENI